MVGVNVVRHGPRTTGGHHGEPTRGAEGSAEAAKEGAALAEPSRDITTQCPAGQWTDHASGCGLSIGTMSGAMTAFTVEPMANAIKVKRRLNSEDVIDVLTDLFILRGAPAFIRSDNGPACVAQAVRNWIAAVGAQTACIEPFVGELIPQITP